jgi:hypothetical protein
VFDSNVPSSMTETLIVATRKGRGSCGFRKVRCLGGVGRRGQKLLRRHSGSTNDFASKVEADPSESAKETAGSRLATRNSEEVSL